MKKYLTQLGKVNISAVSLFALSFAIANSFVYYFIGNETYIYFWDYSYYWAKYQHIGYLTFHSPLNALKEVYHSIRHDDYNLLPVFFLAPVRILLGPGRLPYILAITNIFVLPSAVLFSVIVQKLTSSPDQKNSFLAVVLTLSTVLLFPQFWFPVLFGYPDVAGVVVILIILLLIMTKPFEKMGIFPALIVLGLLLSLLVMMRRWYTFWVISFFIAFAAERFIALFRQYHFSPKGYFLSVRNLFIVGATSLIAFFALATPVARRMISTNYSDIYSAYRWAGSAEQFLRNLYGYFGLFITVLFIAALVYGVFTKNARIFSIFLIIQVVSVVLLFYMVQEFSAQHYYLFIPSMILAISLFVANLTSSMKSIAAKLIFITGYLCVLLIQMSVVFIPAAADKFREITPLFSIERHYPLVRNDLREIERLLNVLGDILQDNEARAYVIASSTIFSDDILRNACLLSDIPKTSCNRILTSSHVDKRDGFPKPFLSVTHIVVAEPTQYHLKPEDQRVTGILAAEINNARGIGSSLEKLPYEFTLDNNVKVYIYRKVRPYSEAILQNLERGFLNYYPDKKDIFRLN